MAFLWPVVFAFFAILFSGHKAVAMSVETTSGTIIGHAAPYARNVIEYLGVPYATPPLGSLRFMPPVAYQSNVTVTAAASYPDCPQTIPKTKEYPGYTPQYDDIIKNFTSQTGNAQSEDCLALDIWAPSSPGAKAILMFFHGGRFSIGGSNSIFYKGQDIANAQDVILVSVNTRLAIFGYPGHSTLPSPNPGLLDQRLAIEWVSANIGAFGGDPERLTIFGQSAGGTMVDYYAYAYPSNPLVAGLISQSGTAFSFAPNMPNASEHYFNNVSALVGCGSSSNTSAPAVLSCMQRVPFHELLNATALVKPDHKSLALPSPVFHPTIDNVTVFSLEAYTALAAAGAFAPIPYLAGNNDNEAGYYKISAFSQNLSLTDAQWSLFNLEAFTCATSHAVAARANAGVPAWQERYFNPWANLELYLGSEAYHGSELTLLFGTTQNLTGIPDSAPEAQFGAYMMQAWASFAREPSLGLTKRLGWPLWNASKETLVRLAYGQQVQASFVLPAMYDGACEALGGDVSRGEGAF